MSARCPECLKLEAQEAGEALVARLGGTGWKVRVWENLGWHYEAYRGPLAVMPSGKEFICYLSDDPEATPPIGSLPAWSEGNSHRDPRKAVLSQLRAARKYLHQITRAITLAEGGRDPDSVQCQNCVGTGRLRYFAKNKPTETKRCPECNGRGYYKPTASKPRR